MKDKLNEHELSSRLTELDSVPARDPQAAARGRSRFLAEASHLRETKFQRARQPRAAWGQVFQTKMPFIKTLLSATIVLLLLVASATTVFAAQNDLPTDPLYGVKLISEDAGLFLTPDPAVKTERLMELAQIRIQEMSTLTEEGQTIPAQVTVRLQQHVDTALRLAAGQNEEAMQASLVRIRTQLRAQEQTMAQLETGQPVAADRPILEQARVMTQSQLRIADEGLQNPQQFRNRYGFGNPSASVTPTPTDTAVPTLIPSETPAAGPTAQPPFGNGNGNGGNANGNGSGGTSPTPGGNGNANGNGNGSSGGTGTGGGGTGGGGGGGGGGGHP